MHDHEHGHDGKNIGGAILINIAIIDPSGMKNLPIALGFAVMSFKGLVPLPIALGAAFQMLTAAMFYRIFYKGT